MNQSLKIFTQQSHGKTSSGSNKPKPFARETGDWECLAYYLAVIVMTTVSVRSHGLQQWEPKRKKGKRFRNSTKKYVFFFVLWYYLRRKTMWWVLTISWTMEMAMRTRSRRGTNLGIAIPSLLCCSQMSKKSAPGNAESEFIGERAWGCSWVSCPLSAYK